MPSPPRPTHFCSLVYLAHAYGLPCPRKLSSLPSSSHRSKNVRAIERAVRNHGLCYPSLHGVSMMHPPSRRFHLLRSSKPASRVDPSLLKPSAAELCPTSCDSFSAPIGILYQSYKSVDESYTNPERAHLPPSPATIRWS